MRECGSEREIWHSLMPSLAHCILRTELNQSRAPSVQRSIWIKRYGQRCSSQKMFGLEFV
jgi:hypothetical protein